MENCIGQRLDLTGDKYGDFTVVEMLYGYKCISGKYRTYCRCVDDDGNEYIIRADALRTGMTKHTKGVGNKVTAKDITGQVFGHLTALYPTGKKASNGCKVWYCLCDCGKYTESTVGNLIRGHTRSCGHRHRSKYEDFIYQYLSSLDVSFETEYRFNDCKESSGRFCLPFDFYFPEINSVIEFDGQHHFVPVKGWGGDDKFVKTKENDQIKNDYCNNNGIRLLRIPYTSTEEEIINLINSFLSPVTITAA